MRLKSRQAVAKDENMIPLINVVFLILIFFLIASTIRPFSDKNVQLAKSEVSQGPDRIGGLVIVRRDASLFVDGREVTMEQLEERFTEWSGIKVKVTFVADAELSGQSLVDLVTKANAAGVTNISLMTRRP